MKLSEMTSEQLARTLCSLTPLLCSIAEDPRVAEALDQFAEEDTGDESMLARGATLLKVLIPAMLSEHEDAFFRAAAILTGKSADVLRRQSGLSLIRELRQCWEDDLALFFCYAGTTRQAKF